MGPGPGPLARRASQVCLWAWVAGWLVASAGLLAPLGAVPAPTSDLAVHFSLFFALASWTATFCRSARTLAACGALTLALGALLEALQGALPYRTVALGDLAANVLGTAAGLGVAALLLLVLRLAGPASQRPKTT